MPSNDIKDIPVSIAELPPNKVKIVKIDAGGTTEIKVYEKFRSYGINFSVINQDIANQALITINDEIPYALDYLDNSDQKNIQYWYLKITGATSGYIILHLQPLSVINSILKKKGIQEI